MRRILWLGLLFFSASWFFFLPFFTPPDITFGIVFVIIGVVCATFSLRNKIPIASNKRNIFFLICLVIAIGLIEFPYSIGLVVLLVGFLVLVGSSFFPRISKANWLWPGLFLSGTILTIQAAFMPFLIKISTRYHSTELISPLANAIGNIFGLNIAHKGDELLIGAVNSSPVLTFSWETLGFYFWINFLIGAIILIAFSFKKAKKRSIAIALSSFFIISIIYLLLRYVAILAFITEKMEGYQPTFLLPILDVFYDPLTLFLTFLPFTLLLMWLIPLKNLELNVSWMQESPLRKKQIITFVIIFCFVCSATAAFAFQDPGSKKRGRLLIDEYHSDWESTLRPIDTEWYGQLSTYNYYSFTEWLRHYYTIDKNVNTTITSDLLSHYDILMLKCPTNPYSDAEVSAIVNFVAHGGGLYMIGDHTNVFGMNSYLNKVARHFEITYKTDATYQYSKPGGFSVFSPSKMLPHPIVQHIKFFQFLTSDSLQATLTADDVIVGEELASYPGTYSTAAFFTEDNSLELTKGFFLQAVSVKYGSGRVVAYTDSTPFSTYSIYLDGYQTFNLGVMDYLNRENMYTYLSIIFYALAILCLIAGILRLKSEKITMVLIVFLVVGALAASTTLSAFTVVNRSIYPVQQPTIPFNKRVGFEKQYSSVTISSVPSFEQEDPLHRILKNAYTTFFVWTQRVNCTPSVEPTLYDAMLHNDLVVIINPTTEFEQQDITAVKDYIQKGGKVLLMDSIYNYHSTSNNLLFQFNMNLTTIEQPYHANVVGTSIDSIFHTEEKLSVGSILEPKLHIQGGRTILTGEDGESIFSVQTYGDGIFTVFVDSSTFSDYKMGGVFTIPAEQQRKLYDVEYYIFESLLFSKGDVTPAEIQGYVYKDINDNDGYNPLNDETVMNATISVKKVDDIIVNSSITYRTSVETITDEKGYYTLSNLMPGYYLVNVSYNGFLIHQSSVILLSGAKKFHNMSYTKPASLQGIVYYDRNNNGFYDSGEELPADVVTLLYIKSNNEKKLVESIRTDDKGAYRFPSVLPGRYILSATKNNEITGYPEYRITMPLLVSENTTTTMNAALNVALVTIYGTTSYDNQTKGNIIVLFTAEKTFQNTTATKYTRISSNSSGHFQLDLSPGSYNISINQTVLENSHEIIYSYSGAITIALGEGIKRIDLSVSIHQP